MRHLYVVTHPQSTHHVERLVGGWYDAELTDLGLAQARAIGERLQELIPAGEPVELYTSDLKRAHQAAAAIAPILGAALQVTPDLREKSYGEAEGKPQAWLDERFVPPSADDNRLDHHEGIPGAETRRDLANRIYRAMDQVLASPCVHQVIVTHGGALTFVVAAWIKVPLEATRYMHIRPTSGGVTHLAEHDFFRSRDILSVNETAHLARVSLGTQG